MNKTSIIAAAVLAMAASCTNGQKPQPEAPAPQLTEVEKAGIAGCDSMVRFERGGMLAELSLPLAYADSNVVFRKVNDDLYIGSGHGMASETLYLIEGADSALLIDTGTSIPELKQVADSLTDKPYKVILTHVHPDHAGSIDAFDEVWINEADTTNLRIMCPDRKCKISYIKEGQIFNLGGRSLEAVFTPGHTPGSTTFMDKSHGYGFSGDSFGNGNLLLTGNFSTLKASCQKALDYMVANNIRFLFNGHYFGSNPETPQRLENLIRVSEAVLSGKTEGTQVQGGMIGLNKVVTGDGFRICYSDKALN